MLDDTTKMLVRAEPMSEPIEPLLLPQLNRILKIHIDELDRQLLSITSEMGKARGFNSLAHVVQKAECIKSVGRKLFSALASQIISTYKEEGRQPDLGADYFEKYTLRFITQAFAKVRRNKARGQAFPDSEANKKFYDDAENELMEWRQDDVYQLSRGYVDGVSWGALSKEMRLEQIQHIHRGDIYNVHANGGTQQNNFGGSSGTQHNTTIHNDLHAIKELISAIQISNLSGEDKENLAVPLEMIVQQVESGSPDRGFFRNAYHQIKQRLEEKAYDGISAALATAAMTSIKAIAQTVGIPL